MRIEDCPECASGWRYSCDLPDGGHRHREGLVKCPRCRGTARIVEGCAGTRGRLAYDHGAMHGRGRATLAPTS